MRELFKIKKSIINLSDDRIDVKPLLGLIIVIVLSIIPLVFGLNGDFIRLIKETLKPLQDIHGPNKLLAYYKLVAELMVVFFIEIGIKIALVLIFNWIIKKIFVIFKKDISLYKLINITIYSLFINNLFRLIILTCVSVLFYQFLSKIPENQLWLVTYLPIDIVDILGFLLYIYGIKIAIRNKN